MFYLGSLAAIFPYLLAISFSLVLGGHASVPLFSHQSASEPNIELACQKQSKDTIKPGNAFYRDSNVAERKTKLIDPVLSLIKYTFYWLQSFSSPSLGLWFLRAPPLYFT